VIYTFLSFLVLLFTDIWFEICSKMKVVLIGIKVSFFTWYLHQRCGAMPTIGRQSDRTDREGVAQRSGPASSRGDAQNQYNLFNELIYV
jgi:hypothetical protein